MKISKLFHWLYATLMFLPFLFFVPSLIYYGFNDNVVVPTREVQDYEQEYVNFNQLVSNTYISNEVNNIDVSSTYYLFSNTYFDSDTNNDVYLVRINPNFTNVPTSNPLTHINVYSTIQGNYVNASMSQYSGYQCFRFTATYEPFYVQLFVFCSNNVSGSLSWNRFNIYNLTQMFGAGNEPSIDEFNNIFTELSYDYTLSRYEWVDIPLATTSVYVDINSNISYAWQNIWQLPLFNWTNNSFIRTPFNYITGLFGMQSTNTFNNVATYFVTISICWLVFDVLMYVPNLAHRWLDRGALE